ncbi:pyridoxamine 5'-phosphate oxidase family protein [Streptomyces kaniharaensis]|uniref:Pyridoxamine 5'-phosphate oxidase family protein n=1 Tax=Streptomyces kaniharaensis TaxID=212423 RepID=A0A6N7KZI6_9ACTN|nr:pyridoxamine 5'-phosphate oxidase family protein [Streptomyces kaniharaensis]MQS17106.1 pyridoxamine 5'-phosphate oxidase family protein [Streptomyces kaniharaensis]
MTAEFTPLDESQCLRLLGGTAVGRLVYTVGALPAVMPVRYRIAADGSVLLHTNAGSEIARAVTDAVVAFEASELSETDGSGWSVTVLGRAGVTSDIAASHPVPAPLSTADWVTIRIRPELVSGRSLPASPACEV